MFKNLFSFFSKKTANVEENTLKKKSVHFAFDFDRWYSLLKPVTFSSELLNITPKEAVAMVHYYQLHYFNRKGFTEADALLLQKLEVKIEKILQKNFSNGGVFVRMSNRSPKDGIPLLKEEQDLRTIYQEHLEKSENLNQQMIHITELQMKLLHCHTAKEIMHLLLSSERIYTDLWLAIDNHTMSKKDQWSTSIILREWQPQLKQENEFRVFVYEGKITAISQYNHYCCFTDLADMDEQQSAELIVRITALQQQAVPLLPMQNYILDVALTKEQDYIIELNPFDKSTGACLYSWEEDKQQLYGKQPELPLLRVKTTPIPDEELSKLLDIIQFELPQTPDKSGQGLSM